MKQLLWSGFVVMAMGCSQQQAAQETEDVWHKLQATGASIKDYASRTTDQITASPVVIEALKVLSEYIATLNYKETLSFEVGEWNLHIKCGEVEMISTLRQVKIHFELNDGVPIVRCSANEESKDR